MSEEEALREFTAELARIRETADRSDAKKAAGETPSPELDGIQEIAKRLSALESNRFSSAQDDAIKAKHEADDETQKRMEAAFKAALKNVRPSSMAQVIGAGPAPTDESNRYIGGFGAEPVGFLKASFRDYEAGEFLTGLLNIHGNPDEYIVGKAMLSNLGVRYGQVSAESNYATVRTMDDGYGGETVKATLGTTGATGGYVLPNNLVDTVIKPATQQAVLQNLVTVRNGVNVRGVDLPYRLGAPSRMTFQDWGATKTNVNETYGSYTAYLGTLAAIYDISKQYARFSAGSAEQDVMDELTKAAMLGENYYMIAGASLTGSSGSGDPTYGIYTGLAAASSITSGYNKAATTSASSSTWLGSFANVLTQAQGNLAARNRVAEAHIADAATYWVAVGQGSDNAGPWAAPVGDGGPTQVGPIPGFGRTPSGGLSYWGVPVYYDSNLTTEATSKILISGEFKVCKLFRGMEFRVDTSDQAGTRWDTNLIGFRGEEELGFHAGPAIAVGALQLTTAVVP